MYLNRYRWGGMDEPDPLAPAGRVARTRARIALHVLITYSYLSFSLALPHSNRVPLLRACYGAAHGTNALEMEILAGTSKDSSSQPSAPCKLELHCIKVATLAKERAQMQGCIQFQHLALPQPHSQPRRRGRHVACVCREERRVVRRPWWCSRTLRHKRVKSARLLIRRLPAVLFTDGLGSMAWLLPHTLAYVYLLQPSPTPYVRTSMYSPPDSTRPWPFMMAPACCLRKP